MVGVGCMGLLVWVGGVVWMCFVFVVGGVLRVVWCVKTCAGCVYVRVCVYVCVWCVYVCVWCVYVRVCVDCL